MTDIEDLKEIKEIQDLGLRSELRLALQMTYFLYKLFEKGKTYEELKEELINAN